MKYNKIKLNNATLHIVETKKFKKIQIDVKFKTEVEEKELSYRSLLPYVLKASSFKYKNKMEIGKALESLYGANFDAICTKRGRASIAGFFLQTVNPKYISSNTLLDEAFSFLNEIITKPNLENNLFLENVLQEEKRLLIDDIEAIKDDKNRYATKRLYENMFSNEIQRFSVLGEKKYIEQISSKDLYDYYKNKFLSNNVDIVVVGDVVKEDIIACVKNYFDFGKENDFDIIDREEKEFDEVTSVLEKTKANQSQLCIGYRTYHRLNDPLMFPMALMNCILGGFYASLLFMNVREKASLAYSVGSRLDGVKGFLLIKAGIDKSKKDEALEIIYEQVERMKKGLFDDTIFQMAKLSIINDLKEDADSISSLASKAYNDNMLKRDFNLEYGIKEIENVTKEQVVMAANNLRLDTVYFLLGGEE